MPPSQAHRASREGERPGPARVSMASSVLSVAWVASLVAFVALWTLGPSVIYMQSMQLYAAAGGSANQLASGSTQAALQHSRRMRGHGLPSLAQDTDMVPGTVSDCQRLQQMQPVSNEQQHTSESGQLRTSPQDAAEPWSQLQLAQQPPQQQQQRPEEPLAVTTEQPAAVDPLHGLPAALVKQLGPVDIVYMWVNGSDPVLAQELQALEARQHKQTADAPSRAPGQTAKDNPVRQSRFDSDRDELRYSLRSLEMYMPWFNHLYIITNGQVPTWLNRFSPRMTVVPHSSILKNHTQLPTFNSNAIATNLANIPGLSDTFILMDDDFFLTAPWTLADLVGPDGGHVLTGSTLVSNIVPEGSLYFQMLTYSNDLYDKHFGPHPRYDPAHSPRLMQKKYLQELQRNIPDEFEQTSASPARTPTDIMIGAGGYPWYVSQFQPGKHPIAPDNRTTFSNMNDMTALEYWNAAVADFHTSLEAQDLQAIAYNEEHAGQTWFNQLALDYKLQSGRDGPKSAEAVQRHLHKLIQTWSEPGAKSLVLNDDITDAFAAARPLMNAVIRGFLEARYSRASPFELSHGVNGCNGRLPKTEFGQLPTPADYSFLCNAHAPPSPTAQRQLAKQAPAPPTAVPVANATSAPAAVAPAPAAVSTGSTFDRPDSATQPKAVPTTITRLLDIPGQLGSTQTAAA